MGFLKGIYLFNFGSTSSSVFSFATILVGAGLGYHTKSWGWRIAWSSLNIFISIGMFFSYGNLMGATIGSLSTFAMFQLPFWISVWLCEGDKKEELDNLQDQISKMTDLEIVQFIENHFNCLIATNHGWLKQYWHPLTDDQKCEWVKDHRNLINGKIHTVNNAIDVIELMQKWSRFKNAC